MKNEFVLSKEDEEFLDSLFKNNEYVCVNCLSSADVDEDQTYIYCEKCEAFTEVKKKESF
jgi:DNA-directed RNA polymerase subunit RPC12/RpoP